MRHSKRMSTLVPAAAILAALFAVAQLGDANPQSANAAAYQPETPFNAAQQRKDTIEQLKLLNERMSRIEAKLEKGINVKVTEMPASAPTKD
jgi:hypothetical protein